MKREALPAECVVFVDGASEGNPGPSGVGVVFVDPQGAPLLRMYKYLGETTNNVAEYLACVYALQLAVRCGVKTLTINSDSELLVKQLQGEYKVRDQTLRLLYDVALHVMQAFDRCTVRHIDRSLNTLADRLARQAVENRFDTSLKTAA